MPVYNLFFSFHIQGHRLKEVTWLAQDHTFGTWLHREESQVIEISDCLLLTILTSVLHHLLEMKKYSFSWQHLGVGGRTQDTEVVELSSHSRAFSLCPLASLEFRFSLYYKIRVVDEMELMDLVVEGPEFESCLGHILVVWLEDPTELMSCGGSGQSSQFRLHL